MCRFLILPALLLFVACGASKLGKSEAEKDIRQDYPVQVTVHVPRTTSAIKGSPDHAKLVALQEALAKTGWFAIQRRPEGDRERFNFKPTSSAQSFLRTNEKGYAIPAAEAEFVKALGNKPTKEGLTVTYQIRLARPTPQFTLFQTLHPDVKIGDTKTRHAFYRKEGRAWVLQRTDEFFRQAE